MIHTTSHSFAFGHLELLQSDKYVATTLKSILVYTSWKNILLGKRADKSFLNIQQWLESVEVATENSFLGRTVPPTNRFWSGWELEKEKSQSKSPPREGSKYWKRIKGIYKAEGWSPTPSLKITTFIHEIADFSIHPTSPPHQETQQKKGNSVGLSTKREVAM